MEPEATIVARVRFTANSSTLGSVAAGEAKCFQGNWHQSEALDRLIGQARGQLQKLGRSVTVLAREAAVEQAALAFQPPRILQFATHGCFQDRASESSGTWDNPLLHSMLIMAGANNARQSREAIYRVGNEVLSEARAKARVCRERGFRRRAWNWGRHSDGVRSDGDESAEDRTREPDGLRDGPGGGDTGWSSGPAAGVSDGRGAVLTMSMWEVPVGETTQQIEDFYNRWLSSKNGFTARYKAFHAAQLVALVKARQMQGSGHPFYWAGVVYVGDPGDLPAVPAPETHRAAVGTRPARSAQPWSMGGH